MKSFIHLFSGLGLMMSLAGCQGDKVPTNVFERTLVFKQGDAGSKFYRIPAVTTAADGSIVVVADKRITCLWDLPNDIDVVCRRSEDMGRTWSETVTIAGEGTTSGYGDPALVLDRKSGNLLCLMASGNGLWQSNAENPARLMMAVSKDNGQSWSAPREITPQIYGPDCQDSIRSKWYGAFISSGNALQLKDGRIMAVMPTRTTSEWGGPLSCYVIYSDDGGETWNVSQNPGDSNGDESKLVELQNGDILMSIRNRAHGKRKFSLSHDRGVTWSEPFFQDDIIEPACNGDMIRYRHGKQSYLLHSIPYHTENRENIHILASYDEGKTWPVKRSIVPGEAAYSSLTVLSDGTIGCFVEEGGNDGGFELHFIRFSPDWLKGGEE